MPKNLFGYLYFTLLIFSLSACTTLHKADGPPKRNKDITSIPDAQPKIEPKSQYGNPYFYEVFGKRYYVLPTGVGYSEEGIASWYGAKFHHHLTSNHEIYDLYQMTAAHKTLPLPIYAKVTNLENGKHVIVKINDRGPFVNDRLIDLSYVAAKKLGMIAKGTARVKVETIVFDVSKKRHRKVSVPKREIYLQLGAYRHMENAEKVLQQVEQFSQIPCTIHTAVVGSQMLYQVRMGPLEDVKNAYLLAQKLGFSKPLEITQIV